MNNELKLAAILYVMAKTEYHILEVESLAKALDVPSKMTFELVGPTGRMPCRWVDAHYGIFERIDGQKGTFNSNQFMFVRDVHCENLDHFA